MGHLNTFQRLLNSAISSMTPVYYDEYYTCCPPPLFMMIVSLIQVGFYLYYAITMDNFDYLKPLHSPLIYDPKRRHEVWRFLTYIFLHKGYYHIGLNLALQLLVGIPLEMVHGWWRVALLYLLGSIMGGLGHTLTDVELPLMGASSSAYGESMLA